MRKIIYCVVASLTALGFTSCYKDIGNYNYHAINEVSFQDFDTINGYSALFGDTLKVSPALLSSQNKNSDDDYTYEWSYRLSTEMNAAYDSVISTSKDLDVLVTMAPGIYTLMYKVTDKTTGVQFHVRTSLRVTTEVYEGYLILNDINGHSRLDMLSYDNGTFTQYTAVLQKMGSAVPHHGTPYQVFCMQYTNSNIAAENYGIFLLTSDGTNRVNQETFGWDPTDNIRYLMVGQVPEAFAARSLTGGLTFGAYPDMYMYDGANVYSYSTFAGYAFKFAPLNVYTASGTPFHVSPCMVTDGTSVVLYDEDAKAFVRTASYNSETVAGIPAGLNYPTGMDLVYMEWNYSNNVYAILKDPSTSKYYMLRFMIGIAPSYYEEITAADFANATHYAVSPDLGYLFYSIGGKVYEYDLSLQKSFLMLDKGSTQITYLAFQNFFNRLVPARAATYLHWAKYLSVGSYDPSGTAGSNGTFELYSVPTVNGKIQLIDKWTGFGKIVSVSYRER